MRKHFGVLALFVLSLLFVFPASAFAYENQIESYDVNIKVNENNSYEITEKIGFYFDTYKHGMYRDIPLRNEVVRLDGTKSYNRAKLTDIYVNEQYESSVVTLDGLPHRRLKIGNPDETITGSKDYVINYTYNLGKDTSKDYDEFYYNIIGPGWENAIIGGISFTIEMPKDFDRKKLGFSAGRAGSTDSSGVDYTVNGNIISGTYSGNLYSGQALTVRLELPDGYFVGASDNLDIMMVMALALPVMFLCITFLLWLIFGKDEKPVETVEFYPPKGFNSAEVGFMYRGKAENKDIVSLIVYLANKGYLKITEVNERTVFSYRKTFNLTKVKEYDGDNATERIFFDGLFNGFNDFSALFKSMPRGFSRGMLNGSSAGSYGNQASGNTVVTEHSLRNNFYVILAEISARMNKKENKQVIFEKSSLNKGWLVGLMIIAAFVLITAKPVMEFQGDAAIAVLPFALLFPGIGFTMLFALLFGKNSVFEKIFGLVWGLIFGGVPWAFLVLPALMTDTIYLTTYIVGVACVVPMIILLTLMPKRTKYGNEMLGKIKGFKNFLEAAEKPRLESLVMQNPSYFYDILPYTYVLGVSDKWIEKFETIIYQPPSWYEGSDAFHVASFGSFMNATMLSATSAMSSSPSSSSGGGGSSGGGSSGGGSGGGGGGSW